MKIKGFIPVAGFGCQENGSQISGAKAFKFQLNKDLIAGIRDDGEIMLIGGPVLEANGSYINDIHLDED